MAASYPTSAKTFTTKATNDTVEAAHVNDLQDEVTALETALIGVLQHGLKFTDATYDIGAAGATRPRDLFLSRNLVVGSALTVSTLAASGLLTLSGGQLAFPATQAPSSDVNTLDDYEEGTWTPVLTAATPGNLSVAYTTQVGRYIKIGKSVRLQYFIQTSTFTHTTASGELRITGVPFAHVTAAGADSVGSVAYSGYTKANFTHMAAYLASGSSTLVHTVSGSGQAYVVAAVTDFPSTGLVVLTGRIEYEAAA